MHEVFHGPGTALAVSPASAVMITPNLAGRSSLYPHFSDEETEAQRLAEGHIAGKWQSCNLVADLLSLTLAPNPACLSGLVVEQGSRLAALSSGAWAEEERGESWPLHSGSCLHFY